MSKIEIKEEQQTNTQSSTLTPIKCYLKYKLKEHSKKKKKKVRRKGKKILLLISLNLYYYFL